MHSYYKPFNNSCWSIQPYRSVAYHSLSHLLSDGFYHSTTSFCCLSFVCECEWVSAGLKQVSIPWKGINSLKNVAWHFRVHVNSVDGAWGGANNLLNLLSFCFYLLMYWLRAYLWPVHRFDIIIHILISWKSFFLKWQNGAFPVWSYL